MSTEFCWILWKLKWYKMNFVVLGVSLCCKGKINSDDENMEFKLKSDSPLTISKYLIVFKIEYSSNTTKIAEPNASKIYRDFREVKLLPIKALDNSKMYGIIEGNQ